MSFQAKEQRVRAGGWGGGGLEGHGEPFGGRSVGRALKADLPMLLAG